MNFCISPPFIKTLLARALFIVFSGLSFGVYAGGDIQDYEGISLDFSTDSAEFVSLGSACTTAHILRDSGLRKSAYPFDWVVSCDPEALIEMICDDFRYFFDDDCLMPIGSPTILLNTHYHLEFYHDGEFSPDLYKTSLASFKKKYTRRIDRFNRLSNLDKKVFFIRESFFPTKFDKQRHFGCAESAEMSPYDAKRLRDALRAKFPNLDFSLIVFNHSLNDEPEIQVTQNDEKDIYIVYVQVLADYPKKLEMYQSLYKRLIQ